MGTVVLPEFLPTMRKFIAQPGMVVWPVTFLQSSQMSNKPMFLHGTLNKKQSSSPIERRHQSSEAVCCADVPVKDKRSCSANDSGASSWHGEAFQVQRIPQ